MKFKIASLILLAYALIGIVISVHTEFDSCLSAFISGLVYVVIPAYGGHGLWHRGQFAVFVSLIFFVSQCVRKVSQDGILPHIAPITVSVPIGDFLKDEGYLIDFFAIFMAVFLSWLFNINSNRYKKE